MPHSSNKGYARPISLKAYCDCFGVEGVGEFLRACLHRATGLQPKHGEAWRFAFWETIIIGYARSATITGQSAQHIAAVAAHLEEVFCPRPQDTQVIDGAVNAAIIFVNERAAFIAPSPAKTHAFTAFVEAWGMLDNHAELHALHALRQRCSGKDQAANIERYVHFTRTLLAIYDCGIQEGIDIGVEEAKERFFWSESDDDGDREDAAAGEKRAIGSTSVVPRFIAPARLPAPMPDTPPFVIVLSDSLTETA